MKSQELLHLQLELECIGVIEQRLLVRIPGDTPDDIARFFVARYERQYVSYCRADLDPQIIVQLKAVPPDRDCEDETKVQEILYCGDAAQATIWKGSSYYFSSVPSSEESPDVLKHGNQFLVMRDGVVAARAWSARTNSKAAELAVKTEPAFRRQGFARQVAQAWARDQLTQGKVAFYSHRQENAASRVLARSLKVVHFVDVVSYS